MSRLAAFCAAAFLACTAMPAQAAERSLSLLSTTGTTAPAVWLGASSNGAQVWFASDERLVLGEDTDPSSDVYERGQSGALQLVSAGNAAAPATFVGSAVDGSRVWFATGERLLPAADTDSDSDVYERRDDRTLSLVSGGSGVSSDAFAGASLDGSRVWFSTRDALAAPDIDLALDIWERTSDGAVRLISGGILSADATWVGATADGARVWFETSESLLPGDLDVAVDVYERGSDGTLALMSPGIGVESAHFAGAAEDGRSVFIETRESLLPLDLDGGVQDIYARTAIGVSLVTAGTAVVASFCDASADGGHVWYSTTEALVPADTDGAVDVYEWLGDGTTPTLVSGGSAALPASFAGASADGARVWFASQERIDPADLDGDLDVYERGPGGLLTALAPGAVGGGQIAFSGARRDGSAVWLTTAEALLPADADGGAADIYERIPSGALRLMSGGAAPLPATYRGATQDGSRLWFETSEGLGDSDIAQDVYEVSFALPVVTAAPVIRGAAHPGSPLTCEDGTWEIEGLLSISRQWLRDGAAMSGASSSSYLVTDADLAAQLSCRVTQRNGIGGTTAVSAPVTVTRASTSASAARLSRGALKPSTFRALRKGPALIKRGGARLRFTLSAAATVDLRAQRKRIGRRVGGRCVARTSANQGARKCTRWVAVRGKISFKAARAGVVSRRLSGRLAGSRLAAADYRLVVVARVPKAPASKPLHLRFTIRR